MSHDNTIQPSDNMPFIIRILTPLRIISIISILSLVAFQISWNTASIIFYGFFIMFIASFVMEVIYYTRNRILFTGLTLKYLLLLPFEFIGVFTFAMATLPFPNTQQIHELVLKVTIMVMGISMIAELYHYVFLSRERVEMDVGRILAIIPMAVLIVYEGIFIYLFLTTPKS